MPPNLYENRTHGTSIFPLQVYSHRDKNGFYQVSSHWHDEWEWIYVEEGGLRLTVHGASFSLAPGEFSFINSGEVHAISASGPSLHHAIVFHPSLLSFALYDACEHNFIRPVTGGQLLFPTLGSQAGAPEIQADILSSLRKTVKLYHSLPRCALLGIKIQLFKVLESLYICEALRENSLTESDLASLNRLKKVIDYMKKNHAQPVSLKQLSELAYMTPTYFCHYFKQETGKTPIQFLNEYRLQKAARLLLETDLSVSEIALACGFDNFSYFIRKFKECLRVTPGQFRLKNKEKGDQTSLS